MLACNGGQKRFRKFTKCKKQANKRQRGACFLIAPGAQK
nr:MAG TPA_asm: hypothetical protein [Caudoviricetes sp.]DAO58458.1 MAG TPA: hypothetical protein [Caudoviricetes sp.]DAV15756.1 MAG TPA: hypothetical protein [Caudoviricetes sp.]